MRLSDIKKELLEEAPWCVFCGSYKNLDMMHLVRRSYSPRLRDEKKNCALGCRDCHYIFDNMPWHWGSLGHFPSIVKRIKELDEQYYYITFAGKGY